MKINILHIVILLLAYKVCNAALIDQPHEPSPLGTIGHEQIAIASEGTPATTDNPPIKKEPHDEVTVIRSESSYTIPQNTPPITVQFSENLRELGPEESAEIRQMPDAQQPFLYETKEIEVHEQPRVISSHFN